uniref:Uncharacterized protein n=1 Tax=Heterorhabditis bacteriophora TaxID=37862 RepID=A0A1I7WLY3_HETBA
MNNVKPTFGFYILLILISA